MLLLLNREIGREIKEQRAESFGGSKQREGEVNLRAEIDRDAEMKKKISLLLEKMKVVPLN